MKVLSWKGNWSFCLGPVIVLEEHYSKNTYLHEYGHYLQFKKYGLLYYVIVAIPSIIGWWVDMLFHRRWSIRGRLIWYYNQPWEKEADMLGGVARHF